MSKYPLNPKYLAFPIIAQCNYRCNFCEINGVDKKLKENKLRYQKNVMTSEQIEEFRSMIASTNMINIGGRTGSGEPTFSPEFDNIVTKIRSINKYVTIDFSTNGLLLTKERTDFLIKHAPVAITFSIHAASRETYSKVMGTKPEKYDQVIENIRYFTQQAAGKRVLTRFNFGIGKENYEDAEELIYLAKSLNINVVQAYLYYKSPNKFVEDVSLYSVPELANEALRKAYQAAQRVRQPMEPPTPNYLKSEEAAKGEDYAGGCPEPFTYFIMKSDPFRRDNAGFAVCNRITVGNIDLTKVKEEDLYWAWYHPVINQLRFPNPTNLPPICKFCKEPNMARLRSLDYEEYKKRRDEAARETLKPFQADSYKKSPTGAIEILSENIFSMDYDLEKEDL
tara:strand:+ start:269 stop:1453 length:1185 start_codon:yes stop_codon:yes gene_type:complete